MDETPPPLVRMSWGVGVPMRDGVELSAILYLPPEGSPPAPAIFHLTPYVAQVYHEIGVYFATAGYPFLIVDIRGRGNSPGVFRPSHTEREDGHDIVEWLAAQEYCDGRVTSWGGSFGGFTQWMAAAAAPPHLATIVPVASPYRGIDSPVRNNAVNLDRVSWLTLVAGRTSQDKMFFGQERFWGAQFRRFHESGRPFREADAFLGVPSPIFQEWLEHPEQDGYWDALNPSPADYARLTIPILTITGHYDGDQPGALAHYTRHMTHGDPEVTARHYLVIGPWDHAGTRIPKAEFGGISVGPASVMDLKALHIEWYRWTMQGGERPAFLKDRVAYYVMGSERWRYAPTLEAATAGTRTLLLASEGNPTGVAEAGALAEAATGRPDSYVYDPRDVSTAALESLVNPDDLVDQRMLYARRGKLLVYESEPFTEATEITGFFRATLFLAIDQPDTDFRLSVHDVAPDLSSRQLTFDTLRARYRESYSEQRLVTTTEPLRYDFERFMFVSQLVAAGHRLRLVVEPVNSIYYQKNHNTGGVIVDESFETARTVTVRLYHDADRPSALHIPLGRAAD